MGESYTASQDIPILTIYKSICVNDHMPASYMIITTFECSFIMPKSLLSPMCAITDYVTMCRNIIRSLITHEIEIRNRFFERPESTSNWKSQIDLWKNASYSNHPTWGSTSFEILNWNRHKSSEITHTSKLFWLVF